MVDVLHEKKRDYLAVLFRKKIVMAFHDYAEATHANHVQKLSLNLANVTVRLFKTTVLLKTTISMLFCFSLGFFLVIVAKQCVTLFCAELTLFCTVLPANCIALSKSE